ncbi:MAG: hypothetical protein ACR2NW_09280 [Thermodesulfobacteriota bacterium]
MKFHYLVAKVKSSLIENLKLPAVSGLKIYIMPQYYFKSKEAELCYTLEYSKGIMEIEEREEMMLYKAKKQDVEGMFWCKEYEMPGEKNEFCGRECQGYKPRNGKSGICTHYSTRFFEPSDEIKILRFLLER